MNKKDEAIKKCLRVLNPIANENVYETQWIESAINAAHEALEEKEWQRLSDEEIVSVFKSGADHITGDLLINFAKAIEQKLKEKNGF